MTRRRPLLPALAALGLAVGGGCAHAAMAVHLTEPDVDAEVATDQILGALHAHRAELSACVATLAPAAGPTPVSLDFVIDEVGAVGAVRPPGSALGPEVDACLVAALAQVRFVPPSDSAPVRVREILQVVPGTAPGVALPPR